MKRRSGFTLIELLVVIAIIGILATIVIVNLSSARVKARDARRQADIKEVQNALEVYNDGNSGAYPAVAVATPLTVLDSGLATALTTSYISALPKDPQSTAKNYYYVGDANGYSIGVTFELRSPAVCKYTGGNGFAPAGSAFASGGTYAAACQ